MFVQEQISRRDVLTGGAGLALVCALTHTPKALALMPDTHGVGMTVLGASGVPLERLSLDGQQSDSFRAWMTLMVAEQIRRGPSPRWFHRDCAGLARFAVREAFRVHDERWRQANGLRGRNLPPELILKPDQETLRTGWSSADGSRQDFADAITLVSHNSRLLGKEVAMVRPGDLLFYDQGDEQHLMIWMGNWIAYHTGQTSVHPNAPSQKLQSASAHAARQTLAKQQDTGLRAVTLAQLHLWKDTRWRPQDDNPNFSGFYRLAFLSR